MDETTYSEVSHLSNRFAEDLDRDATILVFRTGGIVINFTSNYHLIREHDGDTFRAPIALFTKPVSELQVKDTIRENIDLVDSHYPD